MENKGLPDPVWDRRLPDGILNCLCISNYYKRHKFPNSSLKPSNQHSRGRLRSTVNGPRSRPTVSDTDTDSGLWHRASGHSLRLCGAALRAFGKAPVATVNPCHGHGKGRQDAGPTRPRPTATATVNGLGHGHFGEFALIPESDIIHYAR